MSDTNGKIPPPAFSEVVLKTIRFDVMKDWYTRALDLEPFFIRPRPEKVSWTGAQQVAFFRLRGVYPYTQMLGVFEVDGTGNRAGPEPGLHHFQLSHNNLDELFDRYDRLKAEGIVPFEKWNHGVMTSFYYEDANCEDSEIEGAK